MVKLGMNVNGEFWKKHICSRIWEVGKQVWKNGFNDTEREKEYVQMKECPRNESFVDGNVGAGVRLMVRRSDRMTWKYDDDKCRCGLVETERHALFECTLYGEERGRWRGVVRNLKDGMEEYCAHLHHTLAALKRYFPASLVAPLPSSEQTNLPSSNHTYTKSTPKHIHHHYAPSVTSTHTTHIISSTAPTYAPHCRPWICGQTPTE